MTLSAKFCLFFFSRMVLKFLLGGTNVEGVGNKVKRVRNLALGLVVRLGI